MYLLLLCLMFYQPQESTTRYLSLHHLDNKEDYLKVSSFILNSLSKEKNIVKPDLEGNYISFDLKNYNISSESWSELTKNHIVRADWFVVNALQGRNYKKLIGIKNISHLEEIVKPAKDFEKRAVVFDGGSQDKMVKRIPTLYNSIWYSYEYQGYKDKRFIDNLLTEDFDVQEVTATLPNGLLIYLNADGNGNLIDSCRLFDEIPDIEDNVRRLLNSNVRLHTQKDNVDKIMYAYGGEFPAKYDKEVFEKAVQLATGTDLNGIRKIFIRMSKEYNSSVDLNKAARERGMDVSQFLEYIEGTTDPYLLRLRINGISRRAWEHINENLP